MGEGRQRAAGLGQSHILILKNLEYFQRPRMLRVLLGLDHQEYRVYWRQFDCHRCLSYPVFRLTAPCRDNLLEESLDDLRRGPLLGGMLCQVEMHYTAPIMS